MPARSTGMIDDAKFDIPVARCISGHFVSTDIASDSSPHHHGPNEEQQSVHSCELWRQQHRPELNQVLLSGDSTDDALCHAISSPWEYVAHKAAFEAAME